MSEHRPSRAPTPSGLSRATLNVMRHATTLASELAKDRPDVAEMYQDTTLTQAEIAAQVLPVVSVRFPSTAVAAVQRAIHELMTEEERAQVTARRRSETGKRNMANLASMGEVEFKKRQSEVGKIARQKHGVEWEKMTLARGIVPWTPLERDFAFFLKSHPEYKHKEGRSKGHVSYEKVVEAVNATFHGGEPIRDQTSIRGLFTASRFRKAYPR